jgi:glutathione synthase
MDMITAPVLKTLMLRKNELKFINSITEIGIFSLFIGDSKTGQIYFNEVDGLLPRTKQADCDEGGVNAGFAVVDNLLIVDADPNELKPTVSADFMSEIK